MSDLPKYAVIGIVILGGVIAVNKLVGRNVSQVPVNITVPQLSSAAASGKSLFDENCASCHGTNAVGSQDGPPLVHVIYEPGHHSDASFYLAVSQGVRQHHWSFGDMPRQPHVQENAVALIIEYVRELQVANGIR